MKVLRVLRRRKIRLSFICILLLVFIVNSYAWIVYSRDVEGGALVATTSSWGVEFVIADEDLKTEEYTYEIEEFHPGITPIEKLIYVYNVRRIGFRNKIYNIRNIFIWKANITS